MTLSARERFETIVTLKDGRVLSGMIREETERGFSVQMLDQKQFDDALKLLDAAHPADFDAQYGDRRGDVLFAMGKLAEAREAWQKALAASGSAATLKAALEFKLEMAGAVPAATKS